MIFFTSMNQLVTVWLLTVLFNHFNHFHYHFIFPAWERTIQTIFNHSSTILQILMEVKFATYGKKYQMKQDWPWWLLPKLFSCHILTSKLHSCDDMKLEPSLLTVGLERCTHMWQLQFICSAYKAQIAAQLNVVCP